MSTRLIIFTLVLSTGLILSQQTDANPWGKDADLTKESNCSSCPKKKCSTPLLGQFAEIMIGFHQRVISPADGPRSHFIPSSSQYTLDAMRKYGFFYGVAMGCDRLMRENKEPWIYRMTLDPEGKLIKYNPVP
jgi:putative component of membrane protein insertase Oxa1/YidC/SpoIIIJ protein YidD